MKIFWEEEKATSPRDTKHITDGSGSRA